jgi:subtilisin family serine protease
VGTSAPGGITDFLLRRQKNRPNPSGPNKCTLLLFLACLCLLAHVGPTQAQPLPDFPRDKLIHSEDITKGFEQGQTTVKVIVNLTEPLETLAAVDWKSRPSLDALHAEILTRQQKVLSTLTTSEFKLRRRFENQAGFSTEVTLEGLRKLSNNPMVESIEPVHLLKLHLAQGISLINGLVYRSTYNGQGVAIAVCDTGIDYNHSKLGGGGFPNGKVIGGSDFGDDDDDPMPDSEAHGTCCAGIAAGDLGTVGSYIGGVANDAKLYALKVEDSGGLIYNDAIILAWDWCVSHKNDDPCHPILVISNSFGGGQYYSAADAESTEPSLANAANNAVAAGITVLASSGNDGYCDSLAAPAAFSSVISVGAVYDAAFGTYQPCVNAASCATKYSGGCSTGYYAIDNTAADMVTSYSNTASFLTVLSPSNKCYTTDIIGSGGYNTSSGTSGDYYSQFGGTSAACPYAAGAVACLQSAAKSIRGSYLSPSEVRTILTSTGDNITDGKVTITKPRINLEWAINSIIGPTANNINVTTPSNTAITIALQATDDGLPNPPGVLSYIITSLTSHGTLSDPNGGGIGAVPYTLIGGGNQVVYTPTTGYSGPDSFQYKANDGGIPPYGGDSVQANVSISVTVPGFTIFLTETFESPFVNGAPAGWSKSFKSSTVNWTRNSGDYRNDGSHGGAYNALLFYGGYGNHETYLITPVINFGAGTTNATLEFWHKQAYWPNDQDTLTVYYKTGAGGSWTLLASYTTDIPAWTKRTITLPSPGSNYYIGFLGNAKWGYGVCIDDVKVTGIAPQMHTFTISSSPGGSTIPAAGTYQYSNGTVVDINAIPDLNYHFINWTGDTNTIADVNAAVTTIIMDANYAIQANFELTVIAPDITSTPVTMAIAGQPYTYDVDAIGVPEPNFVLLESPAGMDINSITGLIQWTPDPYQIGEVNVTVEANNIAGSDTQSFTISVSDGVVLISGYVLEIDGSTPVQDVLIQTDDNDFNSLTDADGYYILSVDYNWSGIVIPQKEGYVFEPNSNTYANVTQDYNDVNYTATLTTFKIAGYVLELNLVTPINNVSVSAENGGGQWTNRYGGGDSLTDVNGFYEVRVDYGWAGNVKPDKYAYIFEPNSRYYQGVIEDYNAGQDYNGTLLTFRIAGYIKNECNAPITGVLADADNNGCDALTDVNGLYEVWVHFGWSGTLMPTRHHFTFDPNWTSYVNVLADHIDQNYLAANTCDLNCDGYIDWYEVAVIANNWLTFDFETPIPGDFDADGDVDFFDFAELGLAW